MLLRPFRDSTTSHPIFAEAPATPRPRISRPEIKVHRIPQRLRSFLTVRPSFKLNSVYHGFTVNVTSDISYEFLTLCSGYISRKWYVRNNYVFYLGNLPLVWQLTLCLLGRYVNVTSEISCHVFEIAICEAGHY